MAKTTVQFRVEFGMLKMDLKDSIVNRVLLFTEHYKVSCIDLAEFDWTITFEDEVNVIELASNGFNTDDGVKNRAYSYLSIEQLQLLSEALDVLFNMHKGELPSV